MKYFAVFTFLLMFTMSFAQNVYDIAAIEKFQNELNKEFADLKESPLTDEDRNHFEKLDFFPADPKFFVVAEFKRRKKEKPFQMKTSTDRLPVYVKYGELSFVIDEKLVKLNIYQNVEMSKKPEFKDNLFLPFSDLTSGKESYIGGRYLDLKIPTGEKMVIDFNQAYNPYCAYNYKYSCPKVPLENDIPIEIRAGVKKFHE